MDAEQLNKALYDKMAAEQAEYRAWLLEQKPEEILNHAYEYAMREDILIEAEVVDLPARQAAALLETPSPLADTFELFREMDGDNGHMNVVRESIEQRADDLVRVQWGRPDAIPLYQGNAGYARDHDELDLFHASHKANIACRDAIEAAIREGFDGMHLTADVKGVLAEFGPERVTHVLAATLLDKPYDMRFSRDNMTWAVSVPIFDTGTRRYDYTINSHSAVLDGFVDMVRKELDAAREQTAKKPSIKEQLAAKPVPGDQPAAKSKDREVR